jgi:hypothetical protein
LVRIKIYDILDAKLRKKILEADNLIRSTMGGRAGLIYEQTMLLTE